MSEFRVYAWNGNPASPDLRDLLARSHDLLGASPHYLDAKELFDHAIIYECNTGPPNRIVATTGWKPKHGLSGFHTLPKDTRAGCRAKWWLEHRQRLEAKP